MDFVTSVSSRPQISSHLSVLVNRDYARMKTDRDKGWSVRSLNALEIARHIYFEEGPSVDAQK